MWHRCFLLILKVKFNNCRCIFWIIVRIKQSLVCVTIFYNFFQTISYKFWTKLNVFRNYFIIMFKEWQQQSQQTSCKNLNDFLKLQYSILKLSVEEIFLFCVLSPQVLFWKKDHLQILSEHVCKQGIHSSHFKIYFWDFCRREKQTRVVATF